MENIQHADGGSILGFGVTILGSIITLTDVEGWVKLLAGVIAIIAGCTTIYYNVIKIKKAKTAKDE